MIDEPTSNILDCVQETSQKVSIRHIWESHVTTYLLDIAEEWEASAPRRVLKSTAACLSNLPPHQAHSVYASAFMVCRILIFSTATALFLSNGPDVTPLGLLARLKAVCANVSFLG
ncbi:MAG: hypothetical protein JWQ49_1816 [Edaphobacter sp.]|nr:hypothetical protein [Edaphobacter sp.]